jgi:hypothetical protein
MDRLRLSAWSPARMSVTFILAAVCSISLCLATQSGSSSGNDIPTWVYEHCENAGMGKGSRFPSISDFYFVDLYTSPSTIPDPNTTDPNQREFIFSLCNRTLKTPRGTRNCPIGHFFIGVWNASGDCLEAYDVAKNANIQGSNTSGYNITMNFGSSNNSTAIFTVFLTCAKSAVTSTFSIGDQYLSQSAPSLCPPTQAPRSPSSGKNGGDSGTVVIPVVVSIAAAICIILGVGVGYLCFKRRSLPSAPQPVPVTEDGLDSPPSDRRGWKSTD